MTQVINRATLGISGAYLTQHSRDLMEQGDWRDGLNLLTDTLAGMTYEQAIGIIEGDCRMEGYGDELQMVPESPEVKLELQQRYKGIASMGGFLKRNGKIYEAYLVIDNLGDADSEKIKELVEFSGEGPRGQEWKYDNETVHMKACQTWIYPWRGLEMRAMYYAARPETDFAAMALRADGKRIVVLFQESPTGAAPFWRMKENKDVQAAYDQVADVILVSGYSQKFGYRHPSERPFVDRPDALQRQMAEEAADPAIAAERAQNLEDERKAYEARVAAFKVECAEIRQKVCEFADKDGEYGWYNYSWKPTVLGLAPITIRVPHRALICYALSTTPAWELMPEYQAFSRTDMKLDQDNPYHTDVWLGCGFDIDADAYSRNNSKFHAVLDVMFEVQKKMLNFEVQVLARGPEVSGTVVFHDSPVITKDNILVVPHAGVEFELQTLKAGAVICQVGGKLAHLVTVCREDGKPVIRMDNALEKLKKGQRITVSPDKGKVHISASRESHY